MYLDLVIRVSIPLHLTCCRIYAVTLEVCRAAALHQSLVGVLRDQRGSEEVAGEEVPVTRDWVDEFMDFHMVGVNRGTRDWSESRYTWKLQQRKLDSKLV